MAQAIRPLIIAETANPEWVSVPLEGWSLSTALQKLTNAHIVTQIRNRDAFLRAGLIEGEQFTAINSEALASTLWRAGEFLRMGEGKGWTTVMALSAIDYPYFEHLVWKQFGDAIQAGHFDVVHRVTPLSPTISSPIARKCQRAGVPFVMGPINGGVPWPPGYDAERRREREWLSYVRSAYKLLPGRLKTLSAASAIIAGSRHTQSEVPDRFQDKCVYIPENAIDEARFSLAPKTGLNKPLRGCFIGRLVPYKGPDMLITAAADLLRAGRLELDFIGDGPMMGELKQLAEREGVTDAINFRGWVAHEDLQSVVREADLFTFPSVREFGGAVVLEAMMLGVVPVIVDYGGPGEHVIEGTGFKIPIGRRETIVDNLRKTLTSLVDNPNNLTEIAQNARRRVQDKYTWHRKAEQVIEVYDWVTGRSSQKPDPFMRPRKSEAPQPELTDLAIK